MKNEAEHWRSALREAETVRVVDACAARVCDPGLVTFKKINFFYLECFKLTYLLMKSHLRKDTS